MPTLADVLEMFFQLNRGSNEPVSTVLLPTAQGYPKAPLLPPPSPHADNDQLQPPSLTTADCGQGLHRIYSPIDTLDRPINFEMVHVSTLSVAFLLN